MLLAGQLFNQLFEAGIVPTISACSARASEPEFMFKMFLEVTMTVTHALAELGTSSDRVRWPALGVGPWDLGVKETLAGTTLRNRLAADGQRALNRPSRANDAALRVFLDRLVLDVLATQTLKHCEVTLVAICTAAPGSPAATWYGNRDPWYGFRARFSDQ